MKDSLSGKVKNVVLTQRLKSHPVCLTAQGNISLEMEKVLNAMPTNEQKYNTDKEKLKKYTELLYTQACLIEGFDVEDPVEFSNIICDLMLD